MDGWKSISFPFGAKGQFSGPTFVFRECMAPNKPKKNGLTNIYILNLSQAPTFGKAKVAHVLMIKAVCGVPIESNVSCNILSGPALTSNLFRPWKEKNSIRILNSRKLKVTPNDKLVTLSVSFLHSLTRIKASKSCFLGWDAYNLKGRLINYQLRCKTTVRFPSTINS